MRYWDELNNKNEVVRTIVLNNKSIADDAKWIHKNLGGVWRLSQTRNEVEIPDAEQK